MFSVNRILVPTDFSDSSKRALEYALDIAKVSSCDLFVVHVVETFGTEGSAVCSLSVQEKFEPEAIRTRAAKMAEFLRDAGDVAHLTYRFVLVGAPASEIIKFAREREMDLIVMGTHGRKGASRFFFGSVAEKVVRLAPCPVLTVKGDKGKSTTSQHGELSLP